MAPNLAHPDLVIFDLDPDPSLPWPAMLERGLAPDGRKADVAELKKARDTSSVPSASFVFSVVNAW